MYRGDMDLPWIFLLVERHTRCSVLPGRGRGSVLAALRRSPSIVSPWQASWIDETVSFSGERITVSRIFLSSKMRTAACSPPAPFIFCSKKESHGHICESKVSKCGCETRRDWEGSFAVLQLQRKQINHQELLVTTRTSPLIFFLQAGKFFGDGIADALEDAEIPDAEEGAGGRRPSGVGNFLN